METTYSEGHRDPGGPPRRCPPRLVYRRLLAGGAVPLQLGPLQGATVLGCGLVASLVGMRWSSAVLDWSWFGVLAWTIGNALTGLALAAVAAHWLGSRVGMMAGLAHVTSLYTLMPDRQSCAGSLASLAATVAVGAFASAQVPGRFPPADRPIGFGIFCGAVAAAVFVGGLAGPACIFAICLGYLALFQDGPGLRFFTARRRPVIVALSIAAACLATSLLGVPGAHGLWDAAALKAPAATPDPAGIADGVLWAGVRLLPWAPWALLALGAGLRQGHYAAPFGRLLIAWLLGPWTLWAAGAMPARLAFAVFAPAVAMTAAIGLKNGTPRRAFPTASC